MPRLGKLCGKGSQLMTRYAPPREKKTSKQKVQTRLDIIRKNPVNVGKELPERGLNYPPSDSSDYDSPVSSPRSNIVRRPSRQYRHTDNGRPRSSILDNQFDSPSQAIDFDSVELHSPRRRTVDHRNDNIDSDSAGSDSDSPDSTFSFGDGGPDTPRRAEDNYDSFDLDSPRLTFNFESVDEDDHNYNRSDKVDLDIDNPLRRTLNSAYVDNPPPSFLNNLQEDRYADISRNGRDEDFDNEFWTELHLAMEDLAEEEYKSDTDTTSVHSDYLEPRVAVPRRVPRKMLSIPSSSSSSVFGFSSNIKKASERKGPQYWDVMIKLNPPPGPSGPQYCDYYANTPLPEAGEKKVVQFEASDEGYSLLKSFYKVVSEARASGEIAETDLDNTDTLNELITRAAKMMIPVKEQAEINNNSDASELEEFYGGHPVLIPVYVQPGNSICYEFVPSAGMSMSQLEQKWPSTDTQDSICELSMIEDEEGEDSSDVNSRSLELTKLIETCLSYPSLNLIRTSQGFMDPDHSVQIPGRTAEFWPKYTINHKMQDPLEKLRFAMKVRVTFELVQRNPVIDLFYNCYRDVAGLHCLKKLSKELVGKHVFCKQLRKFYVIRKVRSKHSLMCNEHGGDIDADFSAFRATVSVFGDKFGIPLEDFDFLQPLLVCQALDVDLDSEHDDGETEPILLLPQFCYLVGVRSEIENDPEFYMDMIRVTTVQRLTAQARIREFMERFSNTAEVKNELSKSGIAFLGMFIEDELELDPNELLEYSLFSTCSSDEEAWEELFVKCFSNRT